ncbi:MAG TPA: hypothetical protein VJW94_11125 [Candidatus Acidoferrum sp.]|nr:hypothetical protein [Candidatus Acidoferrum sp.]
MHSERKRFGVILAAYAVGGILLMSFCAKRIVGQQPEVRVAPAPPAVHPVIDPTPMPQIAIHVPQIGPVQLPELNFELNSQLNSGLNSDLNFDLNSGLNLDITPTINLAVPEAIAVVSRDGDDFGTHDEETIQKSFAMPAGQKSLEIDNVWGSIEVVADTADKVELSVTRTNQAESKEKLEKAKKEVTLDVTQEEGVLKLYVNGPFRCQCDDCRHSRDDDGYRVKMDFKVHVPRDIDIKVKTVNEGRVVVKNTNGSFAVRNVNGDIEMDNVAGSGTARTVNGPVIVSFRQNPRENSDFKTVNGNVELRFAHELSADFRFKTLNGGIYSDFPVTALPVHAIQEERRGGKVVYRADRYTGARVNSGGPEIQIENLNGDIRILENHE